MRRRIFASSCLCLAVWALLPYGYHHGPSMAMTEQATSLRGLGAPVRVVRDSNDVPHIYAKNDHDAFLMLGYVHAQDRLFQMDLERRMFSGQMAELVGKSALGSDTKFRTYGLRRAAEASLKAYSGETMAIISAYADGVNSWLEQMKKSQDLLPPEYTALELTPASIPAWTPVDTLTIGKGMAFQFSFDLIDLTLTRVLASFEKAGKTNGFDGRKLFFEDVFRFAPFDKTITGSEAALAAPRSSRDKTGVPGAKPVRDNSAGPSGHIPPETLELATKYSEGLEQVPSLRGLLDRGESPTGSNWWVVSGKNTASGHPILANDPHLSLDLAPIFYEAHLTIEGDPKLGPMNVSGVSLAGIPGVMIGCNDRLCWGATVNPMDVTDVYQEQLVADSRTVFKATMYEGKQEPLIVIEQKYRVNNVGDGTPDNLSPADVPPAEGGLTWVVPRRNNGPIIEVERRGFAALGLSVQFTGWGPTREIESFYHWARAKSLDDFKRGLQFYDVGSQNWAVADIEGNIAYFASARAPLREDLQNLGRADGDIPPFFIRDGTHKLKHEWLRAQAPQPETAFAFQSLPLDEMPQVVNPRQGFIASANNDPTGATLDNDSFNQFRIGGGVRYLNFSYHPGLRVGRISRVLQAEISKGKKLSVEDMMRLQADNQLADAEVLTPYILKAFDNAKARQGPGRLAELAATPGVAEAVGRLRQWDFSTPTGIPQGYDPGDDPNKLPEPSSNEARASVCASIYTLWRSYMVRNVIDATLARSGIDNFRSGNGSSMACLRNLLDTFDKNHGRGVSGVSFFEVKGVTSPEEARDSLILTSLQDALNLLASDEFAPAFGKSHEQSDYRWGRMHRIVFKHPLGGKFNIPAAGGFTDLGSNLPGLSRPGGFETLDVAGHSVRAVTLDGFLFNGGPARRFVAELAPGGPRAFEIIPGGESGDVRSKYYSSMLGRWLTNQYHPLPLTRKQVEADVASDQKFEPAR